MKESFYKNYMLQVLLALLAFTYVDRYALGLLVQSIKVDLGLTDTQLGFMSGIAFALFYAVMGIPIARWADRGNRVNIIAISAALSSAALALCGAAGNFIQLLLIRVSVAVGEAGCLPPAISLIADYFKREERPRASAIYKLGGPLSGVIGYFGAGWLNELYGWRMTMVLLGLPGMVLALLAWLTLREPRVLQPKAEQVRSDSAPLAPGWKETLSTLWSNATFRHLMLAYSVAAFFGYGIVQWKAAFFIRSFGVGTGELGTWFAAIAGGGGLLGTYIGGMLAARYAARDEKRQLLAIAIGYAAFAVISTSMYMATNLYVAFALMAVSILGISAATGPIFAVLQTLMPERMRATSVAILLFFSNLIGMGLGPLAAGALSDLFRPVLGEESLRAALLVLCPGYLWCGWHYWRASKFVTRDVAQASPG